MHWITLAAISAVLSAAAALSQKKVLQEFDTASFCFLVSAVTALLSLPLLLSAPDVPTSALPVMFVKSVLQAAAFWCVMSALKHAEISAALPLLAVTPALTALIARGTTGERLSGAEWGALLLIAAGAASVERTRLFAADRRSMSRGLRFVGAALVLYAVTSATDRFLLTQRTVHPLSLLFWQQITAASLFAVPVIVRRTSFPVRSLRRPLVGLVLLTALLTIGYRYTEYQAMRMAPAALVLAVKRTSVIMAAAAGGRMFNEQRFGVRLAGAVLIVAGGFLFLV